MCIIIIIIIGQRKRVVRRRMDTANADRDSHTRVVSAHREDYRKNNAYIILLLLYFASCDGDNGVYYCRRAFIITLIFKFTVRRGRHYIVFFTVVTSVTGPSATRKKK